MADGAVRAIGADQIGRLDRLLLAAGNQLALDTIRSCCQPRERGRPLDRAAVLGEALLEDGLGLRLEQRQQEIVAVRHPIQRDRGEETRGAAEAEAAEAQTARQQALGHA